MKIKFTKTFKEKPQIEYIAKDKPSAARKFKNDLIDRIKEIPKMPYKHRKSIYFDKEHIRDLVFKGYIIVYRVNQKLEEIEVFGFSKYEENLFKK